MEDILRVVVGAVGVALIVLYLRSISVAALLAQRRQDEVLGLISRLVRRALRPGPGASYATAQARMNWYLPAQLICTVAVWFSWLILAFACLYWAIGSVGSFGEALVASGSALSTLGFFTPPDATGKWLAVAEGMVGLVAVVFLFTFVPGFLSAVQARSQLLGWVAARGGNPPAAGPLLLWMMRAGGNGAYASLWSNTEQWFRMLAVTHSSVPELMYVPSFIRGHSWTATAGALLEATAFACASMKLTPESDARVALLVGSSAVLDLAAALPPRRTDAPELHQPPDAALDVQFNNLWQQLAEAGADLAPDQEAARAAWHELRRPWVGPLAAIAAEVGAPSGLGLDADTE